MKNLLTNKSPVQAASLVNSIRFKELIQRINSNSKN